MAKHITLHIFEDPGHGWAKVPREHLVKFGIGDEITAYSYQRGAWVFLEEDGDLSTYYNALKARGYEVKFKTFHTDRQSKIRNYAHYQAA